MEHIIKLKSLWLKAFTSNIQRIIDSVIPFPVETSFGFYVVCFRTCRVEIPMFPIFGTILKILSTPYDSLCDTILIDMVSGLYLMLLNLSL